MTLTCSQPSGAVHRAAKTTDIAEVIFLHYLRTSDVYFTILMMLETSSRLDIHHLVTNVFANENKNKNQNENYWPSVPGTW